MAKRLDIYNPSHSLEWLEKFFSKNYYKKPYDRFMWWRSYTPKFRPLTSRHPFRDRILNGDFDMAPFRFEAEIVEHRINEKWRNGGWDDPGRFETENSLDRARRKRLLEDYEKEESRRLAELRSGFAKEFKMTVQEYDDEVVESTANTIIDFYYEMQTKYGLRSNRVDNNSGLRLAGNRNY